MRDVIGSNIVFSLLRTIYDCVYALPSNVSPLLPLKYYNINDILSKYVYKLVPSPGKPTEPQP